MKKYIVNRTMLGLLTLLLILIFVFIAARLTGNPIEVMYPEGLEPGQLELYNEKYGLDKNYLEQFLIYIKNMFKGDFGISIVKRQPVEELILPRIAETLKLGVWALGASVFFGLSLGLLMAVYNESFLTKALNEVLSFLYAIPGFVLAILLMYIFSFNLKLLPSQGANGPLSYIMPVICLSLRPSIRIIKHVRSAIVENISLDYVQTAVAKGMGKQYTISHHIFRNILIPTITVMSGVLVDIVGGSTVIEEIFSWPGIGSELVHAVLNRDFPVIQFGIILLSVFIILMTYILDVLYLIIDPRIGKGELS